MLNIIGKIEHIKGIERYIIMVIESVNANAITLSFEKYLPRLIVEIVLHV